MGFYNDFAYYYDKLMAEDIDYDGICDFLVDEFASYGIFASKSPIIADLACGTGAFTRRLSERGFDMIGIDISQDMLNVSRETDEKSLYLNQDICEFELYGSVAGITCMIDGLNYVISDEKLQHVFDLMYNYLDFNGIVIFDVTSLYSLREVHGNNIFSYENDEIFYCWENFFSKDNICEMYLNFFVQEGELYRRFTEQHMQKGRDINQILMMLKNSRFINTKYFGDYHYKTVQFDSERIFFVAQKRDK